MLLLRKRLTEILNQAVGKSITSGDLKLKTLPPIILETPKDEAKGDYATTLAMTIASMEKASPRTIAEKIVNHIEDREAILDRVEIAGPGYINLFLKQGYWISVLREVITTGDRYGQVDTGKGKSVQVEFLSANPTGPLHIGH